MEGFTPFYYDALIDIESMASVEDDGFDQAIVDIGVATATWYRLSDGHVQHLVHSARFTINVDEYMSGSPWYRRFNVSPGCMLWWAKQDKDVRASVFGGKLYLTESLQKLNSFLLSLTGVAQLKDMPEAPLSVWGKPSIFDLVALRNAYRTTQILPPYSWRQERCLSTIAYEMDIKSDAGCISNVDDPSRQKHNPEYDARRDLSIIVNWRRRFDVWPKR